MKGFTLIELLIVIVIFAIIGAMLMNAFSTKNSTVSWGPGGLVEMRCINGLQFTISRGHVHQVYDQLGHGVPCH